MAEKKKVIYKCFGCGHSLDEHDVEKRVICPYCSARIMLKSRAPVIKKIKAR